MICDPKHDPSVTSHMLRKISPRTTEGSFQKNASSQSSKSDHNNLKEVATKQDQLQYPMENIMGRNKTNVIGASTSKRAKGG